MNEQEWLRSGDPAAMLQFLRCKASARKLRLFGCACVRRVWGLLAQDGSRRAVEVAECYADRLASEEERSEVAETARHLAPNQGPGAATAAWLVVEIDSEFGNRDTAWHIARHVQEAVVISSEDEGAAPAAQLELATQAQLLRDIFGNPFRLIAFDPSWLTPTALALAQAAYEERDLPSGHLDAGRLAVLADALEDAGCAEAEILGHLRGPGPHVRGCYVLDMLLGRE